MPNPTKTDPLPQVLRQMQYLATSAKKDEFTDYCREVLRVHGRDNESLVRLAAFCQKQQWHDGFEMFMNRLADRLPHSRPTIYLRVAHELLGRGRRKGLDYVQRACTALLEDETGAPDEETLEKAIALAVPHVAARDNWEDTVRTFPEEVQGQLFFELAARWGADAPSRAFRAYQRGFHVDSDAWPGDDFVAVALAHARRMVATDPGRAMRDLQWAAGRVDDARIPSEAAAIAAETGDTAEALRLSRLVLQSKPDDIDNLGRLAGLQAESNAWGDVAALAPAIVVAVSRLNPWQRDEHAPAVDLALEAWLRTDQAAQVEQALDEVGLSDEWQAAWRARLQREE